MEFGWAESTTRLRSRLPNLNLLPSELLPAPLPWLTAGLALFAAGLLMLLYALFYMRSYTELELQALRERLVQGQEVARQLGLPADAIGPGGQPLLPPGTLEDWAELRARQVDWAAVFGTVAGGVGPQLQVGTVSQAGYTVSIAGEAASTADANGFLQRLRDSNLFASLEMSITGLEAPSTAAQPTAPAKPASVPTAAAPQPTVPAIQPQPPVSGQPIVPPAGAPPPAQPAAPAKPVAAAPPAPTTAAAPPQPTVGGRPPPGATAPAAAATALPAATATPVLDWIVQSKRETFDANRQSNSSQIRVRAIDSSGNLIPGVRLRIESEGTPAWSDEMPHAGFPASDGRFEVGVGMGKFTVYLLNGSSERATELFTGVAGRPGVREWDVTFLKATPGPLNPNAVCATCSPTPSPTITLTPQPTPTPISPGQNLAARACVTASENNADAWRAVDGDLGSVWDSGRTAVVQITLDFTRYPNGQANACQPRPASDTRTAQLEALELVTNLSQRARATHEIWTVYDSGSAQLEYTFADVDAVDGQTISARFAATRTVQMVRIRTIRSGANTGWKEIRLFEPLPPAFGSLSPTVTSTPVLSSTPTPTVPAGSVTFSSAAASSENPGNPAQYATDGDPSTFWRPVPNQPNPYLELRFAAPQTIQTVRFTTAMGESLATASATVGPGTATSTPAGATYRVSLLRPAAQAAQSTGNRTLLQTLFGQAERTAQDNDCYSRYVSADNGLVQADCSTAFTGVTGIRIYLESIANPSLPPGIRDVAAYPPGATATR